MADIGSIETEIRSNHLVSSASSAYHPVLWDNKVATDVRHGFTVVQEWDLDAVSERRKPRSGSSRTGQLFLPSTKTSRAYLIGLNGVMKIIQIASGVAYLHNFEPIVIHGDLKGVSSLSDC